MTQFNFHASHAHFTSMVSNCELTLISLWHNERGHCFQCQVMCSTGKLFSSDHIPYFAVVFDIYHIIIYDYLVETFSLHASGTRVSLLTQ